MSAPVIVLGKRECTPIEVDALQTLGYGLALIGSELHTTETPGAPHAVINGYRAAGGDPKLYRTGMGNVEGETIVILDDALASKLDQKLPDWRRRPTWQVLDNERMLIDWVSAFVTILAVDGHDLSEGVA